MPTPATSPAHIGRHGALTELTEAHLSTLSGVPRGVVLAGEAGIGKTRLLKEFVAGLDPEVVVARGQCVAMGSLGTPLAPVRSFLRDLVGRFGAEGVLESAGPAGQLLTALLPELATSGDAAEGINQEQVHDIVSLLLANLSDQAPLVLLVEDVHWADVATLDLVRALVHASRRGRVTTLLSYRTDDVGRGHPLQPVLLELGRNREVLRIELSRLTPAEVAEQALSIRGERLDPDGLNLLVERSEGVPFFVEELLGLDSLGRRTLPHTLRDLVLARYVRLGERTQAVLRLVAAGGMTVEHDLVARVFEGDSADFDTAVREAVAGEVLSAEGTAYTFRHALTHEAVHDELLPGERARFHGRYAAALEDGPGPAGRAAEIAHHWLAAHDLPRAFAATVTASRQARAAGAPASAARLGERALELWPQVSDAAELAGCERADLFRVTAADFDQIGDPRAIALLDEALAETPREDRSRYALLLHETMVVWHAHGRDGAVELCEEALAAFPEGGAEEDRMVRARLQCGLGAALSFRGEPRGERLLEEAAAAARDLMGRSVDRGIAERARLELVRALTNLGSVVAARGDVDGALAGYDEALSVAGADPDSRLRDAERRAMLYVQQGRFDEARDVAEAAQSLSRQVGLERGWGCAVALSTVAAHMALGDLPRARATAVHVEGLRPWAYVSVRMAAAHLEMHLWQDDVAAAEELYAEQRDAIDRVRASDLDDDLELSRVVAHLELARGDLDAAWSQVRRLWLVDGLRAGSCYGLIAAGAAVLTALRRARTEPEGMSGQEAERRLRGSLDLMPRSPITGAWGTLLAAELSGPTGTGTDVSAWQEAVATTAEGRLGAYHHAYAWYRSGEARLAAGNRAGAAESLSRAAELAERAGITRVGRLAADLASRGGLEREGARVPKGRPTELTAREQQVLQLVAEGLTNRQVGERLFISDKTASVHVSAILRKLGAASRTEAAVHATELGLTPHQAEPAG